MSDPRFARFKTDPRFRKLRKKQRKVIVDDRFKSIFSSKDPESTTILAARVDKYGRKLSKSHNAENLQRFYRLEGDEEPLTSSITDYARGGVLMESSEEEDARVEESDLDDDEPVVLGKDPRKPLLIEEEIEVGLDESRFAELDALAKVNFEKSKEEEQAANPPNMGKTNRLAVVNIDWDHVKVNHLYKIFSSVVTSSSSKTSAPIAPIGKVLNVRVYPSQFGKAQMEHEAIAGPPKDIFKKRNDSDGIDVEEDDGKDYDENALRKYQLERLRYYYAIVACDTPETAAHIYSELDGTELERSANIFDLSYVPDDMSFADDYVDEATEEGAFYKAVEFVTDALRHSKVKLTWDNDDPERVKMTRRKFSKKELEEADFKAFLASASSEEGSDDDDNIVMRRDKVRSLLLTGANEDNEHLPEGWGKNFVKDGEMEITFTPGLTGSNNNVDPDEETTRERYLRKQKERKKHKDERLQQSKQAKEAVEGDDFFGEDEDDEEIPSSSKSNRRAKPIQPIQPQEADAVELELLQATLGGDQEPKHFDMRAVIKAEKSKTRKRQKEKKRLQDYTDELQEDFVLDVNDSRFKALHEDHAFAIDPSNPHFKKTKSMSALLEERAKRQKRPQETLESTSKTSPSSVNNVDSQGLKHLVERVKRKSVLPNDVERKRVKIS